MTHADDPTSPEAATGDSPSPRHEPSSVLVRIDRATRLLLGTDPPVNDSALAPSPSWSEKRAGYEEDDLDAEVHEHAAAVARGDAGASVRLRATRSVCARRAFARGDREGAWAIWEALLAEEPGDVDPLLSRALAFSCGDDRDTALDDYDRAVALAPRDPEVFRRRAGCFVVRRDPARALADYRRLVHLCPRDLDALKSLANYLRFTGDHATAIRVAGRAIKLAPWRAELFALRAACWGYLDKRAEERLDLDRWLALAPRDAEARRQRARHFRVTQDEERELADLSLAIEVDPGHVETVKDRAAIHERRGRADLALADLSRAVVLAPEDAGVRLRRARLHLAAGALDEAIADFDVAIPLEEQKRADDPAWGPGGRHDRYGFHFDEDRRDWAAKLAADPYLLRGHAHRRRGDHERAVADYRAALALDPHVHTDLERDEEHARIMKRPAERLDLLDTLVLIAPTDTNHLVARAELLQAAGRHQEALADLDRAIPDHPFPHEEIALRGRVRWALGDCAGALADLDRAVGMAPRCADHLSIRGYLRALAGGDEAEAEADLRRAVELEPCELGPHIYLARTLEHCGRWREAVAAYDGMLAQWPNLRSFHRDRAAARLHLGRGVRVLRAALADYDAALAKGGEGDEESKTRAERERVAGLLGAAEARAKRARERRARERRRGH
jgi:tetratricopeptide (TPR) repeat protein